VRVELVTLRLQVFGKRKTAEQNHQRNFVWELSSNGLDDAFERPVTRNKKQMQVDATPQVEEAIQRALENRYTNELRIFGAKYHDSILFLTDIDVDNILLTVYEKILDSRLSLSCIFGISRRMLRCMLFATAFRYVHPSQLLVSRIIV
jgi:hypothetical protein